VTFNSVAHTKLDLSVLSLPLLTCLMTCMLCLGFYVLSKRVWQDSTKNLMAMSAGCGNTGYFGLPIALMLFDAQGVGIYIMAQLGTTIYENSLGYYILAKGTHSGMECIKKLAKLPALYGVCLGLLASYLNIQPPDFFSDSITHMKGAYTVLGMMIIGLGLAHLPNHKIDYKFIGLTFLAKFAVWPLCTLLFINADLHWFHFFNQTIYNALMLLSIVPIGVNAVIFSTLLKNKPEKAVIAVMLSTVAALAYLPLMTGYFIQQEEQQEIAEAEEEKDDENAAAVPAED
jgi:predicted permease